MKNLQEQIAEKAKEWAKLRVSYKHRGHSRKGCDCSGLLIGIVQELGYLKNFVYPKYPPDWNLHSFKHKHNYITEYIGRYAHQIPKNDRQPGDILLFKYARIICHTGIYVGDGLFIHSYLLRPVCYVTLNNSLYGKRLIEVWRIDERKII